MRTLPIGLALFLLGGCSSSLSTSELAVDQTEVDGLPFRARDQFDVEIYQRSAKGYILVGKSRELMADPSRIYVLHVKGGPLANMKNQVDLNADSTLKVVSLDSDSQLDEAVTGVSSAYKDAATAVAGLRTARKTDDAADKARREALIAQAEAELVAASAADLTLTESITAVEVAEAQLAELPENTAPSVRIAKAGQIAALRARANEAARKAGLPPPY